MAESTQDADGLRTFIEHVSKMKHTNAKNHNGFETEYGTIRGRSVKYSRDPQYSVQVGKMPVNARKNRYKDIVPYDYSRVRLPVVPGKPGTDYINASYLSMGGRCSIIAAQGPLPNTVIDFWRMIWSHNISVIVMAARCVEGGKKKCEQYWPSVGQTVNFDALQVKHTRTDTAGSPDYEVHELTISCMGDVRVCHHFQYRTWPDHGVPESPLAVMRMLAQVREKQPLASASEAGWPIVIHCSAGCGRTGTLAAIDYVWGELKDNMFDAKINIFQIVAEYRKRRQSIVQTLDQYLYVYKAVLDLVKNIIGGLDPHSAAVLDKYDIRAFRKQAKTLSKDRVKALSMMMVPGLEEESRKMKRTGEVEDESRAEAVAAEAKPVAAVAAPKFCLEDFESLEYPTRVQKPKGPRNPTSFKLL